MMLAVPVIAIAGCDDRGSVGSSHARGSIGQVGAVTVQNAYLVPTTQPGGCVIQVDAPAELSFTVTNNAREPDRLIGIDGPPASSVELRATPEELVIPAGGGLAAGQAIEEPARPGSEEPVTVRVSGLRDWVSPGRHVDMSFRFERAGALQLAVPVDSCPTQQVR
ncbi:hypothetical protein ACFXK0_10235 [Nocardia sp. NPDC059177]|uniref:hypothetical protein n=1 Tax=Nocardia sp. NPDC059177 TaxID=3346759 RepID=UPI0036AA9C40